MDITIVAGKLMLYLDIKSANFDSKILVILTS